MEETTSTYIQEQRVRVVSTIPSTTRFLRTRSERSATCFRYALWRVHLVPHVLLAPPWRRARGRGRAGDETRQVLLAHV